MTFQRVVMNLSLTTSSYPYSLFLRYNVISAMKRENSVVFAEISLTNAPAFLLVLV